MAEPEVCGSMNCGWPEDECAGNDTGCLKNSRIPLSSDVPEEEYNVTERVQVRDECIAANDETIQRIAEKYGVGLDRQDQDKLKLEHLIDYIFPPSTPLRLEYDIQFEVFFKERLEAIERKLSLKKFQGGLTLPRPQGLIKP